MPAVLSRKEGVKITISLDVGKKGLQVFFVDIKARCFQLKGNFSRILLRPEGIKKD